MSISVYYRGAVIVGGSGGTLISKTIYSNGVYDPASDSAYGYSQVTVNVVNDLEKNLLASGYPFSYTVPDILSNNLRAYGMYQNQNLTAIDFNNAQNIPEYFNYGCFNLSVASGSACKNIGSSAFQSCSALASVSFPVCTDIGIYAFQQCSTLASASFQVA